MTPLAPADMKARKRPLAVLFVYGAELVWGLVVATPVHTWARQVWGAHPEGDGVLFRAGGRELLVWLGQGDAGLEVTAQTTMALLFLGALAMQLPLGALIASLAFSREAGDARRSLRPLAALRVGVSAFMPLAGALALGAVVFILLAVVGTIAASAIDHGLAERLGDARSFQLRLVTLGLFMALAAVFGVVLDLARAAMGREAGLATSQGAAPPGWTVLLRGLRTALRASRRMLVRATLAWAWRAALGVVLVAAGYAAAQALGGRGGLALFALFVIHQLVVLGRVGLRASWLARALAVVAPVQDAAMQPARIESSPPAGEPETR
jgi:hypothetical protein